MTQETVKENGQANGGLPPGMTWNVVRSEQPDRILFEEQGDCLIGLLVAKDMITPPPVLNQKTGEMEDQDPFLQLVWKHALVGNVGDVQNPDYERLEAMPYVSTNAGFALASAYDTIPLETWTRNTLVKLIKVKDQPSAMKDFRVETPA